MQLGRADLIQLYRIFLSSGDDALELRDRVEGLIERALNPQLKDAGELIRFEVDRWERTAAHRTRDPETNAQFVRRALQSHLTLTLLLAHLGEGTRGELEAVLDETDNEISALWFVPRRGDQDSSVATWLNARRERVYYDRCGTSDSHESWEGIFRVLIAALLDAKRREREDAYVEER
jgi:hypothetical protein